MARNDQVIRQWHLIGRLENASGLTLQQLADGLPDDVPKHLRTLRRDLSALESAGVPLVTDSVGGQTRWKLLDGFRRLPALALAPSELMALVFSRDLLRPLQGTHIHAALDSALMKASAALPPSGLDFVRQMRGFLSVRFGPHKTYRAHRDVIDRASRAIADRRTVQMRYLSASTGKTGRREIDPYHLWYAAGGLYLIGYCHRRRDVRTFAVERIRSVTLTDHPYQLPLGFDIEAYVQDALVVMRGRQIAVELVFDRATAAWARDRVWHPSQQMAPLRDGRLRMALRVADTRELVGWILSFGRGARVIKPAALQEQVRREALVVSRQ
ncbi:MAG: WYL domain-containing protein [Candidatus Rokubacteria bacterium]|nr:WYL domain-containing protein [Candidatus Rokubacteria bacterium]